MSFFNGENRNGIVLSIDGKASCVGPAVIRAATAAEPVAGTFVGPGNKLHELNEVTAI